MIRSGLTLAFLALWTMPLQSQQHQHHPRSQSTELPIFTEEREAAALVFVRKHRPEMARMLEHLKENHREHYERHIRDLFRTSERLANLRQRDSEHAKLALKGWQLESRLHMMAAQMAQHPDQVEKRKEALQKGFEELIDIQIQIAARQVAQLQNQVKMATERHEKMKARRKQMAQQRLEQVLQAIHKKRAHPPETPKSSKELKPVKPLEKKRSPEEVQKDAQSLFAPMAPWRTIGWQTSLITGIQESRKVKKPILLWVFIDRPVDDERC